MGLYDSIRSALRLFIKRDVPQNITTLQLTKLDVADKKNWIQQKDIDIGLGAESVLKVVWSFGNIFLKIPAETLNDVQQLQI